MANKQWSLVNKTHKHAKKIFIAIFEGWKLNCQQVLDKPAVFQPVLICISCDKLRFTLVKSSLSYHKANKWDVLLIFIVKILAIWVYLGMSNENRLAFLVDGIFLTFQETIHRDPDVRLFITIVPTCYNMP